MKKSILCLMIAAGMLVSCDPIKEEKDFDINSVTASELQSCLSFEQLDADGNKAADGNYFTYKTSPAKQVTIYNYLSDGSENILAYGTSGSFTIKPKRGSDPSQTFYARVVGSDGTVTDVPFTYTVFVQQELDPEIRLLASDSYGSKTWKWDTSIGGGDVWGNMGYCGGAGADVALSANGYWWGVKSEEDFLTQLVHTDDHAYHGDGDVENSYMVFTDEGILTSYNANGEVIRTSSYSVDGYDASAEWRKGLLKTTAILWPYQINWEKNGYVAVPGEYEIVYLTADKLCLVYPDGGAYSGLGAWGEATFWHFKSSDDIDGMGVGYGKTAVKAWTWDTSIGDGEVWGNMGYCGGNGSDVGLSGNGKWWGVKSEEEFAGQLQHTPDGALHGDESLDAYFTLSAEGIIERHAGDGSLINSGSFSFDRVTGNAWKQANLNTTAGTILWPYEINSNGNMPTIFEVVYLTNDKMTLVYPDKGAFDGLGNWGEASFWHFKAK